MSFRKSDASYGVLVCNSDGGESDVVRCWTGPNIQVVANYKLLERNTLKVYFYTISCVRHPFRQGSVLFFENEA